MKARLGRLLCGLLGSGVMAATLHTPQAVALSEDELLDKFSEVPVFVMVDSSGGYVAPVSDLPNDGLGNVALLRVFFNEDDVVSFVRQIREENPRFHQGGSVGVIDLATVHRLAQEDRETPVKLLFIPQADDLQAARALDSDFGGATSSSLVPLFALQDASGNYVSLSVEAEAEAEAEEDTQNIFSMFFSKEDADGVLEAIQTSNPDLAQVRVGVISLADLSGDLLQRDDDAFERVQFLPDSDVINHIQDLNLE